MRVDCKEANAGCFRSSRKRNLTRLDAHMRDSNGHIKGDLVLDSWCFSIVFNTRGKISNKCCSEQSEMWRGETVRSERISPKSSSEGISSGTIPLGVSPKETESKALESGGVEGLERGVRGGVRWETGGVEVKVGEEALRGFGGRLRLFRVAEFGTAGRGGTEEDMSERAWGGGGWRFRTEGSGWRTGFLVERFVATCALQCQWRGDLAAPHLALRRSARKSQLAVPRGYTSPCPITFAALFRSTTCTRFAPLQSEICYLYLCYSTNLSNRQYTCTFPFLAVLGKHIGMGSISFLAE